MYNCCVEVVTSRKVTAFEMIVASFLIQCGKLMERNTLFRCKPSPQHNGGEEKEHQMRQAQHSGIQDVSEHRNGMTLAHTCNDKAQKSRDEQNDPFRITRRSTQDSDDNDAPHH